MNAFDRRWQQCVRKAREALPNACPAPPQPEGGWLTIRPPLAPSPDPEVVELQQWWSWYGARSLVAASVVLVACLIVVARDRSQAPTLRPGVEDAVAEVLWRL